MAEQLSERQKEILTEISYGKTGPQIAVEMHLSPHTVRYHMREIHWKLSARSNAHAVAIALTEGILST